MLHVPGPCRGFITLSLSLGLMAAALHAVLLRSLSAESDPAVVLSTLRALGTLLLGAPYHRLPPQLLPRCVQVRRLSAAWTWGLLPIICLQNWAAARLAYPAHRRMLICLPAELAAQAAAGRVLGLAPRSPTPLHPSLARGCLPGGGVPELPGGSVWHQAALGSP